MGRTEAAAAFFVTPLLFVGDALDLPHIRTSEWDEAVDAMLGGVTVLVPTFDVAREVLLAFGAPQEHIAWLRSLL